MSDVRVHAATIEMVPLAALKSYEKNARTHPQSQIDALVKIIREGGGGTTPLLIDDEDEIVAGHGRALAAAELGMTEVPCVRLRDLTPDQIKAIRISDNATSLLSGWDQDLLRVELGELQIAGFDMGLTGFGSSELTGILASGAGRTDPDDAPEPPAEPTSRLGDVWVLGDHRIVCGSCTDPDAVARALDGAKPHLMVTDPPYGVSYDASFRNGIKRADGSLVGARAVGKVENDDRADWREAWALFPGDVAYVWCASLHIHEVADSLIASGFGLRASIIWAKNQIAIGRGHYHWQHEPCWYAVKEGGKGHWAGDRKQSTVWNIDKPHRSETGHSTQKPVECMKRPIENNSKPGDHVYEPFSGSGTTIIAGEMTGRAVHAIELNPAYVDCAVQRWMNFTGEEAFHESGEPWSDVVEARRVS